MDDEKLIEAIAQAAEGMVAATGVVAISHLSRSGRDLDSSSPRQQWIAVGPASTSW